MKKFIHPFISHTLIYQKDGSSYGKYWIYFRSILILETEVKSWTNLNKVKPTLSLYQSLNFFNLKSNNIWFQKNK